MANGSLLEKFVELAKENGIKVLILPQKKKKRKKFPFFNFSSSGFTSFAGLKLRAGFKKKDFDWDKEEDKKEYEKFHRMLSKAKIEILVLLWGKGAMSISELSAELGRDYKNVYKDVMKLEEWKVVKVKKVGKKKLVSPLYKSGFRVTVTPNGVFVENV